MNLKAKIYMYVNSTTQRCPNKIIEIFLLDGFFHLPPVSLTPVENFLNSNVSSTTQRWPNKIIKFFWLKIFFICHRCQRHRWSTLSCEYLCEFSKKFETVLMVCSGAWGKLIHEINRSRKSRDTVPLKILMWREFPI